ncbi:UDP-glucose 4-epimerase GalE [Candidatus Pelagibacter bacterium]|nr:UDP-glucose 4-epimerase GalE [Candidatus Pelagibacter bacterium]
MKNFLLTGGAGYIGSHVAHMLIDKGHKVTIIDSLITGSEKIVPKKAKLIQCDISNEKVVTKIIQNNKFDIVMHFAGLTRVDDSIKFPKKYDNFNYKKAKIFINTCFKNNLKKIIFSSTASVYGNPKGKKVSENDKLNPMNPYAKSKLKLEKFIINKSKIHKAKYIILRYFNVAGADYKKRTGMIAKASTNLIKVICEVASGKRKKLIINGNNFNTKDGTTIRDFIHVSDLAQIHNLSAKYLIKDKKSQIFNCGYGKGFSILDVIKSMNFILKKRLPFIVGKPRKKDIYFSVADTKKFNKHFRWKPKYNSLNYILTTALNWEKKQK